jgi:hypothetical protein
VGAGGCPFGLADHDDDLDVDGNDFNLFQPCMGGASVPPSDGCAASDLDGDGDVDQTDFGLLQQCFSGFGLRAAPGCTR